MKYLKYTYSEAPDSTLLPFCDSTPRGAELYSDLICSTVARGRGVITGTDANGEICAVVYSDSTQPSLIFLAEGHERENDIFGVSFDNCDLCMMRFNPTANASLSAEKHEVKRAESLADIDECVRLALSECENPDTEEEVYRFLRKSQKQYADIYYVSANGRPLSTASVVAKNKKYAVIGNVFTDREYRGRGYAAALVRGCVGKALGEGLTPVLFCERALVKYYEGLGFEIF